MFVKSMDKYFFYATRHLNKVLRSVYLGDVRMPFQKGWGGGDGLTNQNPPLTLPASQPLSHTIDMAFGD
jgi:hypothetical protein